MLKRLKKIASGLKAKFWPQRDSLVKAELMQHRLTVVKGTIASEDYDDAWLYLIARNSTTMFDIGANIGSTALLASVAGIKKIVLVDPNPEALACAAKNMILNSMSDACHFVNAFVSANPGEKVKFYSIGYGAAGSMYASHAQTASTLDSYYMVNTTTVDELSKKLGMVPDFVKIDVEGAESLVLQGASELSRKSQIRFLVEMHATREVSMEENATTVINWCKEVGYQPWYLKQEKVLTDPFQIAERGKCHLLLQPSGWIYPGFLTGIKEGTLLSSL